MVRGWAIGLLHLSPSEFYEMRFGWLLEGLAAYREAKDADRRHIGELIRGAALRLFNLELKPKDRIKDPKEFWRMPWDPEDDIEAEVNSWTKEERDRKAKEFLKRIGEDDE